MILPTKHIPVGKSLLGVGGTVLEILDDGEFTVSTLWEEFKKVRSGPNSVSFDWFILSLDLLYMVKTLELDNGLVRKIESK